MTIPEYLSNRSRLYKSGHTTKHFYRTDLQKLIESLAPAIRATNEP